MDGSTGQLAGKAAIVVGGGQSGGEAIGIGRATAVTYAREGARLLLVDKNEASANETKDLILSESPDASVAVLCIDISRDEECARIGQTCLDLYGAIDILQNTVGVTGVGDHVEMSSETWDALMAVNLKGAWLATKYVLPAMRVARRGSIINISSGAAIRGHVPFAYSIAKAGMNALTRTLAAWNASYLIRANAIMPGLIDTSMAVDTVAAIRGVPRQVVEQERAALTPMGKEGTAWDVANLSLFLASDASSYLSGECIGVDGALEVTGAQWRGYVTPQGEAAFDAKPENT
jgi:NAD(P)-dependent dehydrogenase (short-subunit alcohol dehydrogenase family)